MMSRVHMGIFCLLLISAAYLHHPVEYDNTSSRYYLLSAFVDYSRLDIDMYKDETIDASTAGGHTYSNKAIGSPLVAAPVYWVLRNLTPIKHDMPLSRRARYICRVVTTTVPFAALGVGLYWILTGWGLGARDAFYAVLAYAFGTIAWIHASMFSGHQMAANFLFLSFAVIWRLSSASSTRVSLWFLSGMSAGIGGICDYTAIFGACVLTAYAVVRSRSAFQWLSFIAGGACVAAVLMSYNTRCFGGPFSFSYANLAYGEFAKGSEQGILGVALPDPSALLSLLVTPARGLFFIMPVALMAIPGFVALWRCTPRRAEFWTIIVMVVGYLLINAGFYGWHGGWTFGPRYLVPMLPFLAVAMAFGMDRRWIWPLLICSTAQIGLAQMVMPHTPQEIANPVVECLIPLLQYGYFSETPGGIVSLSGAAAWIPLVVISAVIGIAVYRALPVNAEMGAPSGAPSSGERMNLRQMLYIFSMIGIFLSIVAIRTPDARVVHYYLSRLLGNAAYVERSPALAQHAVREHWLSEMR